jgi:hypothetical protein
MLRASLICTFDLIFYGGISKSSKDEEAQEIMAYL